MHLFMAVMGYKADEIVKYTTSPEFKELSNRLNASSLLGNSLSVKNVLEDIITEIEAKANSVLKENPNADITIYKKQQKKYQDIVFLYNCAQEMSKLAKICAINQGTKVDETVADAFYKNFENVISEQAAIVCPRKEEVSLEFKNWEFSINGNTNEAIAFLIEKTHNFIPTNAYISEVQQKLKNINEKNKVYHYMDASMKINLQRYFSDSAYRQFCVEFYDIFKHNFNILDCLNNLPHFYEMLHAFVIAESTIKKLGSRARVEVDSSSRAFRNDIFTKKEAKSRSINGEEVTTWKEAFTKVYYGDNIQRKAGRFYDDYVLSEFLNEHGKEYTISYKGDDDQYYDIIPTSNKGIADFANFMAFEVIPALQELYPKNTFLMYIRPDFRRLRKGTVEKFLPKYKFNFDIDNLTSVSDQNKAFYITQGFEELGNVYLNQLGFDLKAGRELNIAELFYLYDKITSLNGIGTESLDLATDTYIAKSLESGKNTIAKQLATIVQEHDRGIRPDPKLDPYLFTAFCYQTQIKQKQNGVARFGVTYSKEKRRWDIDSPYVYTLNIADTYLFNLQNIEEDTKESILAGKFLTLLKNETLKIALDPVTGIYTLSSPLLENSLEFMGTHNELSLEGLFKDLNIPEVKKIFVPWFMNLQEASKETKPKLESYETRRTYKKFAERMRSLGVEVETIKDPNTPNGFVKDGKIILNESSEITTTPIHELMHLVLAVMKEDKYDSFERLMSIMMKTKLGQKIFNEIDASQEYSNLMLLDKQEEAFCRLLEQIIKNNSIETSLVDEQNNNVMQDIEKLVIPFISKTFGILPPISMISFLSDSISSLPGYNSTLFMRQSTDSTGYLESKTKIIRSIDITNWIEKLIQENIITATTC